MLLELDGPLGFAASAFPVDGRARVVDDFRWWAGADGEIRLDDCSSPGRRRRPMSLRARSQDVELGATSELAGHILERLNFRDLTGVNDVAGC